VTCWTEAGPRRCQTQTDPLLPLRWCRPGAAFPFLQREVHEEAVFESYGHLDVLLLRPGFSESSINFARGFSLVREDEAARPISQGVSDLRGDRELVRLRKLKPMAPALDLDTFFVWPGPAPGTAPSLSLEAGLAWLPANLVIIRPVAISTPPRCFL